MVLRALSFGSPWASGLLTCQNNVLGLLRLTFGWLSKLWNIQYYRDNGKEHGNYYNGLYRGYIGFNIGLYGWLSKIWSLFGSLL